MITFDSTARSPVQREDRRTISHIWQEVEILKYGTMTTPEVGMAAVAPLLVIYCLFCGLGCTMWRAVAVDSSPA